MTIYCLTYSQTADTSIRSPRRHFNLICANLPYIPTETLHGLPVYGREPTLALDGGPDGLNLYRRLFNSPPTGSRQTA
jgi:methylase of polypeptide subunit release factors